MATQFTAGENPNWKRSFFTIWVVQALSLLGSQLVHFAIIWYLTIETESATVLATASMVGVLPAVILSPFIGALVDRWNRRRIMIVADTIISLLTAVLALLFLFGVIKIWHIYTLLLLRSVAGRFHGPAMIVSTSLMVPKEQLTRIQGLNQTLNGGLNIISAPLGALLIEIMPTQGILAIDFVTAVIAIVPLFFIAIPQPERDPEDTARKTSVLQDMKVGLQYILGWKGLLILSLMATLLNFLFSPAISLIPLLVKDHFSGDATLLGWMSSAFGIGVVVGGVILGVWGGFKRKILTSISALIGIGIGTLALGLVPGTMLYLALVAYFVVGVMIPITNGATGAIMQSTVDPAMQGRVFTFVNSVALGMSPVGLAIAGPVSDWLGIQIWFIIAGVACSVMGLVQINVPAVMDIEAGPQPEDHAQLDPVD